MSETTVWIEGGPHHGSRYKQREPLPPSIRLTIRSWSVLDGLTDDCVVNPTPIKTATYHRRKDTTIYEWVKP